MFLLFSHNRSTSPIAVDSDSDFISKRVPGIRSCTKHLSRLYRLSIRRLQSLERGPRPRNYAVSSCRPSQTSGWWNHLQLDAGSVEEQNLSNVPEAHKLSQKARW